MQLFEPLHIGTYQLKNRIVLAPLTRSRASAGRMPNAECRMPNAECRMPNAECRMP